jgi:hypothetical protein
MQRNKIEHDWYHVKGFSGVWSTDPWIATDMIGSPIRHSINRVQQSHEFSRYASRNRSVAAQTVVDVMRQPSKREAKQQAAALSTWEDEGGATAAATVKDNGE